MQTCENCGSSDLMTVDMTLKGGPVAFTHCRRCEHRWWADRDHGGTAIRLADVLGKAAA